MHRITETYCIKFYRRDIKYILTDSFSVLRMSSQLCLGREDWKEKDFFLRCYPLKKVRERQSKARCQFHQHFMRILYKIVLRNFSLITVWPCIFFWKK